jgi:hypothetical protein
MSFQPGDEVFVRRLVDHLRQRLEDLLFRVIDILQAVQQQVFHRFDVLGEESHK